MKIRTGLVVGTVLSLGLVTGCGGGDADAETGKKASGNPKASASAGAAGKPVYKGKRIPGLAAKPAWALAQKDGEEYSCPGDATFDGQDEKGFPTVQEGVCQVGDAFVLVQDRTVSDEESETEKPTVHLVAHLFDAATGEKRKSLTVKCGYDPALEKQPSLDTLVQVGEWKDGSPALLIRTCENTEASGLKAATLKKVYTMYDPNGRELGSSTLTGERNGDLPVVRGHIEMPDGEVTFAPIGGGKDFVLERFLADETIFGTGQGYVAKYNGAYSALRLADRTTGEIVWNTDDDVTPPSGLRGESGDIKDGDKDLFPLRGDRATLMWTPMGSSESLITTVDLPTGRTVATGPSVEVNLATTDLVEIVVSPDGKTAVSNFGEGALAWNTETGAELWRQEADEKNIEPLQITPGGVLYAQLDDTETAALAADTKELLGMVPDGTEIPKAFSSSGYTLVDTRDGLFAFEAEKA
ncbi:PQQ-binding-like beta-propeller repeat protein [Streptomyces europaeiscabiei]|uniref:PQQ-binding-like beta-propeller repeat protein n=1 Tax=Streptomyces europaeiscabiei TaxID=146819 RepID=A0AAJ2PWX8_9ACTN|nr:PQQ-binding-like beta-propeller repeat protein [Streptomyces europaeiscabiei]MDX3135259.1 PQQ-binding-like beta-propeller repeat protein [Streptomyces europaeiscabiei]